MRVYSCAYNIMSERKIILKVIGFTQLSSFYLDEISLQYKFINYNIDSTEL